MPRLRQSFAALLASAAFACSIPGGRVDQGAASTIARSQATPPPQASLVLEGVRVDVGDRPGCAALSIQPFYEQFCEAMAEPDWRKIIPPAGKPLDEAPEMMARITRAYLARDPALCDDPTVLRFVQAGLRGTGGQDRSKETCLTGLERFWQDGGAFIRDLSATDRHTELRVVVGQ